MSLLKTPHPNLTRLSPVLVQVFLTMSYHCSLYTLRTRPLLSMIKAFIKTLYTMRTLIGHNFAGCGKFLELLTTHPGYCLKFINFPTLVYDGDWLMNWIAMRSVIRSCMF